MKKVPRGKCTVVGIHKSSWFIDFRYLQLRRSTRSEAERMSIKLFLFYFNWLLGVQVIMEFYYMQLQKCKQSSPIQASIFTCSSINLEQQGSSLQPHIWTFSWNMRLNRSSSRNEWGKIDSDFTLSMIVWVVFKVDVWLLRI